MNLRKETYDFICFSELVYEGNTNKEEVDLRIKRRLHAIHQKYDESRVKTLRSIRDELSREILLAGKSKYYKRPKQTGFADLGDFEIEQMFISFKKKYKSIADEDLLNMIEFSIYVYYVR